MVEIQSVAAEIRRGKKRKKKERKKIDRNHRAKNIMAPILHKKRNVTTINPVQRCPPLKDSLFFTIMSAVKILTAACH